MPVKVVDASALGALVFGEPGAETVAKPSFQVHAGGAAVAVVRVGQYRA